MTILTAVGGDRTAHPVVATARDLADAFGDSLVVLHVMEDDEFQSRQDEIPGYDLETAQSKAEVVAEEAFRASVDGAGDVVYSGRVGEPVVQILETAEEFDARYIVVGGRKRTPVGKAIFGSVTQSVLLEAEQPVVTVMQK